MTLVCVNYYITYVKRLIFLGKIFKFVNMHIVKLYLLY
eukprot:UN10282